MRKATTKRYKKRFYRCNTKQRGRNSFLTFSTLVNITLTHHWFGCKLKTEITVHYTIITPGHYHNYADICGMDMEFPIIISKTAAILLLECEN